jgi:hypothetical protein
MSDFSVRSDNVDVEQIMRQIRSRIREKRGVTTPRKRSASWRTSSSRSSSIRRACDRAARGVPPVSTPEPPAPNFAFGEDTLYETHRGPIPVAASALPAVPQAALQPQPADPGAAHPGGPEPANAERAARREQLDALHYEVIHNLVVELTRTGVE